LVRDAVYKMEEWNEAAILKLIELYEKKHQYCMIRPIKIIETVIRRDRRKWKLHTLSGKREGKRVWVMESLVWSRAKPGMGFGYTK